MKMNNGAVVATVLISLFSVLLLDAKPVEAYINVKPSNITILKDTVMYDDYTHPDIAVGVLSGPQGVTVVEVDQDWKQDEQVAAKWYLVETWMGNKWIKAGDSVVNGKYSEEQREITTIFEIPLYDRPGYFNGSKITPQKLHTTGNIAFSPTGGVNATSFIAQGNGQWYMIDTWLGEKWILNPDILENVKEEPLSYDMKLTGEETVYPVPFIVVKSGERITPQVVLVLAKWDDRRGPWGSLWYKIRLQQGIRWVALEHDVLPSLRVTNELVELPTETRYFDNPQINIDGKEWLNAGAYKATEASGDWYHIETGIGLKWVNPLRGLQERPIGIVQTNETVELTKDTETYAYPQTGELYHLRGFFSPQTVTAYEKWISGTGEVWYHFRNWTGGNEWVRIQKKQ
ncbi:hypothetical protein [Paenibacillus sp. P36]|uniref:hypothetical protein n=1 Tax=Paenibacillus sp. P36 TaxID=3342538 RepID=UPI0038B3673C